MTTVEDAKAETKDVYINFLHGKPTEIKLYDNKGFVILKDVMPNSTYSSIHKDKTTADFAVAEMARVSYGSLDSKTEKEDTPLIEYLMEHWHTSPFEGVKFKFIIKAPLYVVRQLLRHRTANVNEYSMRYSAPIEDFYFPEIRIQDLVNRQGSVKIDTESMSEEKKKEIVEIETRYLKAQEKAVSLLEDVKFLNAKGVANEVTRSLLPTAELTQLYFCMDLHNLFHFLRLRMDIHAQKEIRVLADAMFSLITPIVPVCCNAFQKFRLSSISFSREEQLVFPFAWESGEVITPDKLKNICKVRGIKFSGRQINDFLGKCRRMGAKTSWL